MKNVGFDFLETEKRLIANNETEADVELNFFIYKYEVGRSRISYGGKEYLCFPRGVCMSYGADLTEDEKKMSMEAYHVYLLSEREATYLTDNSLTENIVKEYQKRPQNPQGHIVMGDSPTEGGDWS